MFYSIFFDYAQRVLARILRILIMRESPRTLIKQRMTLRSLCSLCAVYNGHTPYCNTVSS